MNERLTVSQEEIDWLVEGEMTCPERDELLGRLDQDPSAWRRCAMAFLETASLRKSVQQICLDQTSTVTATAPTRKRLAKPARSSIAFNSIAASLLLSLGFWFGANWIGADYSTEHGSAADAPPSTSTAEDRLNSELWRDASRIVSSINVPDGEIIALVSLPGPSETRMLPVIQSKALHQQFLDTPRAEIPQRLAQQLYRNGWRVNYVRQLLSFKHPNGKSELLPIDLMNYRFVGQPQL